MDAIFNGTPASPGVAIGPVFIINPNHIIVPEYVVLPQHRAKELELLLHSIHAAQDEIKELRSRIQEKLGEQEAQIFTSHLFILEDPLLESRTREMILNEGWNAAYAIYTVLNSIVEEMKNLGNEFLQDRTLDIQDVGHRILKKILKDQNPDELLHLDKPVIIAAHSLSPSETALIDKKKILGILTETGGATSHVAILARALQVPAIVGAKDTIKNLSHGSTLAMDGNLGEFTVSPSKEQLLVYHKREKENLVLEREMAQQLELPSMTKQGTIVSVKINLELMEEIVLLSGKDHDGIGLCRTEFLYLDQLSIPSEEKQLQVYRKIVEQLQGRPATMRTLDIGGDKAKRLADNQYFEESNPFLGIRGIRLSFFMEDLFREQIRAILRASRYGPVKILFPMIAGLSDFQKAVDMVNEEKQVLIQENIHFDDNIQIGAMIEIPSAAFNVDILAKAADFVSIGTNDLIQYVLAADRTNAMVLPYYNPFHPSFIRLLNHIIGTCNELDCPVSVCGELGADDRFVPLLIAMGLKEFSISPVYIGRVKKIVRNTDEYYWKNVLSELLRIENEIDMEKKLNEHIAKNKIIYEQQQSH